MLMSAARTVSALLLFAAPLFGEELRYENRSARELTLRRDGARLVITDGASIVASAPVATTDRVVIRGATGPHDDTLTIDLTNLPVLRGGIDYDGGAGGWDTLVLIGGSARVQRVTQLNPNDGDIDVDGLAIRYRNLEPISDFAPAASYTILGTADADSVTFSGRVR